jgi:fermentation-respiration switch protein FrsA (DUF1100 family)
VVSGVVRDFPGPAFVTHGIRDLLVPVTISRELVATRAGTTVYVETDAQHLRSWQADTPRYRGDLLRFLQSL